MTGSLPSSPDPYDPTAPLPQSGWTAPLPGANPGYPPAAGAPYPQGSYLPVPPAHRSHAYPPNAFAPNGYPPNAYAAPYPPFPPPAPAGPRNGFGVTALVCGLAGVLFGLIIYLFVVTGILGIVAVVFGILGISRARRGEATNMAVSVAGTVLGLVACVASALGLVAVVHRVSHGVGKIGDYVECVSRIPSGDPQYDAKVQDCLNRFD